MGLIKRLNTLKELKALLDCVNEIKLYGAGYYLEVFLNGLKEMDEIEKNGCGKYFKKISCIMVSDTKGNFAKVKGISVMDYQRAKIKKGDYILLTLGHRFTDDICMLLKDTGATIFEVDFNLFHEVPYRNVMESLRPFIDTFPDGCINLNMPVCMSGLTAWTCWWQGEKRAPSIVKACIESQRRNLPKGVRHIVITEENYKDYIRMPEYIVAKVKEGRISLATMSDMIRAALLYKYGGFWMDSTLFVVKPLEPDVMEYPIYTRKLAETQFCTNTVWSGWFLYAKQGNELFRFLEECFFYYFSVFDKLQYYLMIDYIIAIACNTLPCVESQFQAVPINNEKAMELGKHLAEKFDRKSYQSYIEGTYIQKLTYKINDPAADDLGNTIYDYLIGTGKGV